MPRGSKPREYPQRIVDLICGMYLSGMTVAEIRASSPKGYRVQTILERYLPERRKAIKRDQTRELNHTWAGDSCGYKAAHLRLRVSKGPASLYSCVDCGGKAAHWSYVHGCDAELKEVESPKYCTHQEHYAPRCVPCHFAYDKRMEGDAHV